VIGLDQDAKRFEIAKKLGADHIINGSKEDVVSRVRELTGGLGADIVVETANHPSTVPLAISLAAARGRVHLFGLYPETSMSPLTLLRAGVTLSGDVATLPRYFLRAIAVDRVQEKSWPPPWSHAPSASIRQRRPSRPSARGIP